MHMKGRFRSATRRESRPHPLKTSHGTRHDDVLAREARVQWRSRGHLVRARLAVFDELDERCRRAAQLMSICAMRRFSQSPEYPYVGGAGGYHHTAVVSRAHAPGAVLRRARAASRAAARCSASAAGSAAGSPQAARVVRAPRALLPRGSRAGAAGPQILSPPRPRAARARHEELALGWSAACGPAQSRRAAAQSRRRGHAAATPRPSSRAGRRCARRRYGLGVARARAVQPEAASARSASGARGAAAGRAGRRAAPGPLRP